MCWFRKISILYRAPLPSKMYSLKLVDIKRKQAKPPSLLFKQGAFGAFRAGCVSDGCFYSYRAADVNPLVLEDKRISIATDEHGISRKQNTSFNLGFWISSKLMDCVPWVFCFSMMRVKKSRPTHRSGMGLRAWSLSGPDASFPLFQ